MSETRSNGLRELARRYYTGDLSYESYRSERTSLLDRVTQKSAQMSTSNTGPGLERTRVVPVPSQRRRPVWIFIMIVVLIAVLVWLLKSGWITLSLASMQPGTAAPSVACSTINRSKHSKTL